MQMAELTSTSLPGNPSPALFTYCPFQGCILLFSLLLRAQVTLPTNPFHFGTNWAMTNQSWDQLSMVT